MTDFQDTFITASQLDVFMRLIDDQTKIQDSIVEEQQMTEEYMQGAFYNISTVVHPCSDDWPGPEGFSMCISSDPGSKSSWVYSSQLNKVFLPMNSSLPIQFKCYWREPDLYVRALPVFLEADELHKPVSRCSHHLRNGEVTNVDFPFPSHVVRCENMDACYVEDPKSKRLSVITPLGSPPPGTDYVVLLYKFVCKNSCMGGMNRRPIQVVFTLERQTGEVVGRTAVKVRICSCPKRDIRKEEEAPGKDGEQSFPLLPGGPVEDVLAECASQPRKKSVESTDHPEKSKKVKLEAETSVRYMQIIGDDDFFKKCAGILRTQLFGLKAITGQELTTIEKQNLAMFNCIIGDVPSNIKEEDKSILAD